ncbi:MAG: site-specific DNA-methyltransferase [Bacteroidetes bacterium]|nr:site-specific DNA-methyltransferase [Bacteroidota bacterium]
MADQSTPQKVKSPMNRSLSVSEEEGARLRQLLLPAPAAPVAAATLQDQVYCADFLQMAPCLPDGFADLVFLDPPYNLTKQFGEALFNQRSQHAYAAWIARWLPEVVRCLRPGGSLYFCADWRSSAVVQMALEQHLTIQNRITFEREKGRGSHKNWKNCQEDIWFATKGPRYTFHADAVKLRRRVIAPYTHNGKPRDWETSVEGRFRLTAASNLWTDITIPFWSMPENTEHPTQKPEKLLAKILLASSHEGDLVLDPFLGSGTTAVVARKLGRHFVGIEQQESYGLLALKRLELAALDNRIQGYADGCFWERNSQR